MAKKLNTQETEREMVMKYPNHLPKIDDPLVNRVKLFKKVKEELKLNSSDKVLEFGCNSGYFVNLLKDKEEIIGIDTDKDAVKLAKGNVFCKDVNKSGFKNKEFNKIFSFHTIEHIENQYRLFKELDRLLDDGGIIVLVYPYELIRGMAILRTSLVTKTNPRKLHIHKLNPKKIKKYIEGTNLKHVRSKLVFCMLPQYMTTLRK